MSETIEQCMERLPQLVNANARLVWRGRYIDTTFLVEIGDAPYLVQVSAGRIASVKRGPFIMPSWSFALRASHEAWEKFWLPLPPPGFQDLLALSKRKMLCIEGDLHPFMSNLLYFKEVMAAPRAREGTQ